MEINQELVDAINDQLNFELYSAFIYLSMGTWLEEQNLTGMAHWMEVQYQEEFAHANGNPLMKSLQLHTIMKQ